MPSYQFEALDPTGQVIRDVIDAPTEEEAHTTIRQMGYFVTKLNVKKSAADGTTGGRKTRKKTLAVGGGGLKALTTFTRQLSILQDAGLPILRSLQILEEQQKGGKLKNAIMDTCDHIESGDTLSEAMSKCPRMFDRLYINMIKAGEAGGALETILQRLADFKERAMSLRRKVIGAMIYPALVVCIATLIVVGIMIFIVPTFQEMFEEFELDLPVMTQLLIGISEAIFKLWFLIPLIPIGLFVFIILLRQFNYGKVGWDLFMLQIPIIGSLVEKNVMARTTRTLATLISSGVPILEALTICRDTAGNGMFERMYLKVSEGIREGDPIAVPLNDNCHAIFHPMALFFWLFFGTLPGMVVMIIPGVGMTTLGLMISGMGAVVGALMYLVKMRRRIVDSLIVNMVDVGEETGELDTMLYKVADQYDEEVRTVTDGLMAMIEPLMIVFLGGAVGFIVIALFLPLIQMMESLS
ncbi:MAG: type II secretion system F family protein [Pirellulaceae bacterium]|jgi:type IV pilus assembly protein PilC|nr:type II secretion system F family protein [Pirellulaceae bacterium]